MRATLALVFGFVCAHLKSLRLLNPFETCTIHLAQRLSRNPGSELVSTMCVCSLVRLSVPRILSCWSIRMDHSGNLNT